MKKSLKKFSISLLVLSLAACGSSDNSERSAQKQNQQAKVGVLEFREPKTFEEELAECVGYVSNDFCESNIKSAGPQRDPVKALATVNVVLKKYHKNVDIRKLFDAKSQEEEKIICGEYCDSMKIDSDTAKKYYFGDE